MKTKDTEYKVLKLFLALITVLDMVLIINLILNCTKSNQKVISTTKEPIVFETLKPTETPMPIILMVAQEEETPVPTAEPTPTPEPTPTEKPVEWIKILATAYSSREEENGGYGAVDCKHGQPLPSNAVATNLKLFKYGTKVNIQGIGERVVVDTASSKTIAKMEAMAQERGCEGWIDIYYGDDYEGACNFGIQVVYVQVIE